MSTQTLDSDAILLQIDDSKFIEDDAPWPTQVHDRVSFTRMTSAEREGPAAGVRVLSGDDVRALAPVLNRITSVELHFSAFTDGRGYTQAKVLRDQLGFAGDIRATGDVGPDQVHYLREVGCSSFVLRPGADIEAAARALKRFSVNYRDRATRRTLPANA